MKKHIFLTNVSAFRGQHQGAAEPVAARQADEAPVVLTGGADYVRLTDDDKDRAQIFLSNCNLGKLAPAIKSLIIFMLHRYINRDDYTQLDGLSEDFCRTELSDFFHVRLTDRLEAGFLSNLLFLLIGDEHKEKRFKQMCIVSVAEENALTVAFHSEEAYEQLRHSAAEGLLELLFSLTSFDETTYRSALSIIAGTLAAAIKLNSRNEACQAKAVFNVAASLACIQSRASRTTALSAVCQDDLSRKLAWLREVALDIVNACFSEDDKLIMARGESQIPGADGDASRRDPVSGSAYYQRARDCAWVDPVRDDLDGECFSPSPRMKFINLILSIEALLGLT